MTFVRRIALVAALLATPAMAQDVVGKTVLGGKRVELLSDKTWRFVEAPQVSDNCVPINNRLSFCGSIIDWRPSRSTGTDFLRVFRGDVGIFGGIIDEELGSDDGVDIEYLRNEIIVIAAEATNVRPEDIPILDVVDTTVDGLPAETVVYQANYQGLDLTYYNTLVETPASTWQFVVWGVGANAPENLPRSSASFLEAIRIEKSEVGQ